MVNLKNKKILFVIANSQLSGSESQMLLLASNLNNNKFNSEICCLESEGTFSDAVKKTGIPLHVIHRRHSFDLNRLICLIKLIRQRKYQIVHSFNWSANQYVRIARIFSKFTVISSERGRDYDNHFHNSIEKLLSYFSDIIIFNSFSQMKKYKIINKTNTPTLVINNGIDTKKYKKDNESILRSTLQLQPKITLVGTIVNFSNPKNFKMFIYVCEKIIKIIADIHFIAIGEGENKKHYAKIIRQRGLSNHLSLLGGREEIENNLPDFDIFLLTSRREGMPNVILESMASEVPVIATKVDGCKEIIQDGVNGYLVDVDNVDDMVTKIMLLIKDSNLREEVVQNGLLTIKSKFLLKEMVNQHQNIYQTS